MSIHFSKPDTEIQRQISEIFLKPLLCQDLLSILTLFNRSRRNCHFDVCCPKTIIINLNPQLSKHFNFV